jgi:hypothetical protein
MHANSHKSSRERKEIKHYFPDLKTQRQDGLRIKYNMMHTNFGARPKEQKK